MRNRSNPNPPGRLPASAPALGAAARVALIGAGHAHVEVLRQAAARTGPARRLVLVVDRQPAIYSGMLPGFVAGHYPATQLAIDAVSLARRAGAEVVLERACRIDAAGRRVRTASGRELAYDFASLDVGAGVLGSGLPGVAAHALAVRPIERLIEGVDALLAQAREPSAGAPFRLFVVGAGAGGVELAFCFQARLRRETRRPLAVTLLDRSDGVLPGAAPALARRVTRAARRRGIELLLGAEVASLELGTVRLANGRLLAADAVVWSTGPAAHSFLRESGLPVDARGFVRVRPTLEVEGCEGLFAVGDCASLAGMQRAGVYAVRCGPILAENLRRAQAGRARRVYRPQREFLSLLNLGDGTAVGAKRGFGFEGRWAMRLKDRIDRRFVERYR